MAEKKVLIVDNDTAFLEEFKNMLVLGGYHAIPVNDSTAALSVAQKTKPDVILMDINLKGLNGFQVANKLNQSSETADIPVIALSGPATKEEHHGLMRMLGIRALIRKPFHPVDVISCIEMHSGSRDA